MEEFLKRLPPRPKSPIVRIATTTALTGICFFALQGIHVSAGVLGFFVMFPAIFLASVLFDRGSGLYSTVLSTILLYFEVKPAGTFLLPVGLVLPMIIFVVVALGLAVISEGLRTGYQRAAEAERAKDLLLQELSHRTKNNLAMVSSLLSLQARMKSSPEAREALEKAVRRIHAIADAHDHFRPSSHNGQVEMRSYIEELCGHLGDTLRDIRPIAVKVDAEEVNLPTEQAIPLGLIVNELVTNALKHAFPGDRGGTIAVKLFRDPSLVLTVADDGVGCHPTKMEEQARASSNCSQSS
ncbi:ATP-binding protein [Mesorhizobium sp. M1328]|uniref:sensor histidine kinase n=1 Tax=Mesorhizobium sp. M1328 TaxID=2957082 RepID=UPI00333C2C28